MQQRSAAHQFYLLLICICGWFALAAQFYITYNLHLNPFAEMFTRYFSYFTITTNLLVTICCTSLLLGPGKFFSRYTTIVAITVYILVVGLVYNIILRALWKPVGLQLIVNELLHSVIPVLFILYWYFFVPKVTVRATAILPWLLYPVVYTAFIFTRGAYAGFYPYPFIDVNELGMNKALLNGLLVAIIFIVLSLLIVWIGNRLSNKKLHEAD